MNGVHGGWKHGGWKHSGWAHGGWKRGGWARGGWAHGGRAHGGWAHGGRAQAPSRALLGALLAWSLAWKAASLWRAAKDDSKPWFVVLLLSNTAGVLDALYLARFSKSVRDGHPESTPEDRH